MKHLLLAIVIVACVCVLGVTWDRRPVDATASLTGNAAKAFLVEQGIYDQIAADIDAASAQKNDFEQVGTISAGVSGAFNFGYSQELDGDTAIVGAWQADIDGKESRGAAYIFVRSGGVWVKQQELVANDIAAGDRFGADVDISGNTAIVGSYTADVAGLSDRGAAYIFVRNGSTWTEQQKLVANDGAADDKFGYDVGIDEDTAIIAAAHADVNGASNQGAAYVFVRSGSTWTQQQKLVANDGATGDTLGVSATIDGDTALVAAETASVNGVSAQGAAYIFVRNGTFWSQQQKLVADDGATGDYFGSSVVLRGNTASVGALLADVNGNVDQGAAYVFVRNAGSWTQQQKLVASDGKAGDHFGRDVDVSGSTAIVGALHAAVNGANNQGSAYFFVRSNETWSEQQKLVANDGAVNDSFGGQVTLHEDTALIGAPFAVADGNRHGKVYVYERAGLRLVKSYSPISARVTLTTAYGSASVVLTDTIPSGLELMPGTLSSTPAGAVVDPSDPRRIRWNGVVTSASPVTIQYQVRLAAGVEAGSVLGSEVVATTSSGEHYVAQASLAVEDAAFRGALLLVYIAADTAADGFNVGQGDLSDEALRLVNLAELKANTPDVRTVVMLDGPGENDARTYNLKYDTDSSCPNYNKPYCSDRANPYVEGVNTFTWGDSVANPYSLAEFVNGAMLANPSAETVLLSLVGHGGGWTPEVLKGQPTKRGGQPTKRGGQPDDGEAELAGGLLWDVHHSDALSTEDLGEALSLIQSATGRKVDLLYLDACLMAMSEVAYEIRNGASYLLASESWNWSAFPYDQHIADAGAIAAGNDAKAVKVRKIGEAWLANDVEALAEEDNYPFTYSLIDLAGMPALNTAQNALAGALIDAFAINEAQTRGRLDVAFAAAECVDSDTSGRIEHDALTGWADNYCDLGTFAVAVRGQFSDTVDVINAAQQVSQALAGTVVANSFRSGMPHLYGELPWVWNNLQGLTIYLPLKQDEWKRRYYNELFLPSSVDSRWGELLARYWTVGGTPPPIPPDPTCPEAGCPLPPAPLPVVDIDAAAVKTNGGIQVQWWVNDATTITAFTLQRILQPLPGRPVTLATLPNPSPSPPQPYAYLDATATGAYEYCYQVIALGPASNGSSGNGLAFSNFTCAYAGDDEAPLTAEPGVSTSAGGILVEWEAAQAAADPAGTAAGYRVYRSVNRSQPQPTTVTLVDGTQYLDTAVVPNVEYCYTVHAIGPNGELVGVSDKACMYLGEPPSFIYLPRVNR